MVWSSQNRLELIPSLSKSPLEERRLATHYSVSRLENKLHRAQLVLCPTLADMRTIWQVCRLVPHRERPNANPQLLIQTHIQSHSLVKIRGRIVEVIEHVVREFGQTELMGVADRQFILALKPKVVKSDP